MLAPASRQRAASSPISCAETGSAGCASLVVSAPTPATVMMSLSISPLRSFGEPASRLAAGRGAGGAAPRVMKSDHAL